MYKFLFKLSKKSSVVFATTFLLTGHSVAQAQNTPDLSAPEFKTADIRRTDAAYQTLQELNAKYDCIPSNSPIFNTKKQVISRADFAVGINSCIQSIEEIVASRPRRPVKRRVTPKRVRPVPQQVEVAPEPLPQVVPAPPAPMPILPPPEPVESSEAPEDPITQQDLDGIKSLINAFGEELQALDSKVALKKDSFSTTTKLVGEGIMAFSGYGGITANATRLDSNNFFTDRLRLNFDTSFTGKDRLRSRLQARNTTQLSGAGTTGTNMTRLGFDGNDTNDSVLSLFQYDLPLSDETKVRIATVGYEFNDNQPTLNPLLNSSGSGLISRFGRYNPILRLSGDGAAVNIAHKFSQELSVDLGYAVPGTTAATVTPSNGFFKGQNVFLSQVTYSPMKDLSLAALYGRSYNPAGTTNLTGSTGSSAAANPFGATVPTTANHYSFMASYKLSDAATISGWAGFIDANRETAAGGSASISNYAITLAFPNFGAKGNMLGFAFGIPPKLNSLSTAATTGNPDTSYHLEAIYRIKLTDNIEVTPGMFIVTNPEHNSANPTAYVGTVRTLFKF